MHHTRLTKLVYVCVVLLATVLCCGAQWITQSIPLEPGWNAVFLHVDPVPSTCDDVFGSYPDIESVNRFSSFFSTLEFIDDPGNLLPKSAHWGTWLPETHPEAFTRSLRTLRANGAYIIKVADAATPFSATVKGYPVPAEIDWQHGQFMLTGLPVLPSSEPFFNDFFAHTDDIGVTYADGGEIHGVGSDGYGQRIIKPSRAIVEAGKAYWIKSKQHTDYAGKMAVTLDGGDVLGFSPQSSERSLTVKNVSSESNLTVRVRTLVSEDPPAGQGEPERAGEVPLSYFNLDLANGVMEWTPLPADFEQVIEPESEWQLRLTVRWDELADYTPVDTNGAAYMNLIEFTSEDDGLQQIIGVQATE